MKCVPALGRWTARRPSEEAGDDRPQFGQHDRDQDQTETDMQALVQPVDPRGFGRPVEGRQLQPADIAGDGLPELWPVGDVGQQAGDDDDRQHDQQHRAEHRRQPEPAQRAAPTRDRLRRWRMLSTVLRFVHRHRSISHRHRWLVSDIGQSVTSSSEMRLFSARAPMTLRPARSGATAVAAAHTPR